MVLSVYDYSYPSNQLKSKDVVYLFEFKFDEYGDVDYNAYEDNDWILSVRGYPPAFVCDFKNIQLYKSRNDFLVKSKLNKIIMWTPEKEVK
jgi:hypothetical protein